MNSWIKPKCFNSFYLLSLLMSKLPHPWPLGASSSQWKKSEILKSIMTGCSRFVLGVSYPRPRMNICPRSPGSYQCKILLRKITVWALGVFIAIGLVVVSGLFEWTELVKSYIRCIYIKALSWALEFVMTQSRFSFPNLISLRFPIHGVNLISSSYQQCITVLFPPIYFWKTFG